MTLGTVLRRHTLVGPGMAPLISTLHRFLGGIVLLSVSLQPAVAGSMTKVWELDLGEWNSALEGSADKFPVMALSFSPDGKRIALTGGQTIKRNGQLASHLLVVDVGKQQGVKAFDEPGGNMVPDWSPSGNAVVVNGILVQIETRASCSLPPISRFLSEDQIVGETRDLPSPPPSGKGFGAPPARRTHIAVYDKNCRHRDEWQTLELEGWNIVDVSIERHLLLMNKPLTENLLVEPGDGRARGVSSGNPSVEPLEMPEQSGVSRAVVSSYDEATFSPDEQAQHCVSVFWEFKQKLFAAHLNYVANDPKGPALKKLFLETVRSIRPLDGAEKR